MTICKDCGVYFQSELDNINICSSCLMIREKIAIKNDKINKERIEKGNKNK